ncbi:MULTISPECIES: efflux RND transporter periplasmic adaptor subunit [Agarivorans]|uniref:efflux RND transporter periplasmic adaptor subunit n=1 Tax=Agarivorans TaxID=261825 RepID=UPI0010F2E336|nr:MULTISPECIES: efflux RND transporter periplasmic adaptor subunit [Agarivorans]UPW18680.1 efflux RND transporter periplasmic adaptor subunit [Agarivorans sp. TSD2052]GDY26398.1 lipoprotein [Agarivorans sp. Toyoura001]
MFHSAGFRLITVTVFIAGMLACNGEDSMRPLNEDVRPVKIMKISVAGDKEVSIFPAIINDNRLVDLSFTSGGKVISLPVKNAQFVKKGEVIASLDQRELKNSLNKFKAQFRSAEIEYNRARQLSKNNAISQSALQERLTERDVKQSQLDSALQAINDSVLTAPFDGVIAKKMVDNGQTVSSAQAIVKFIGGDTQEASIDMPANYLAELYQSTNKQNNTNTFIVLDIAPERKIAAYYREATLLADSATQTYNITFEFSAPSNLLVLPGMNATIEIHTLADHSENHPLIPLSAITSDGSDAYVWVVNSENMTVTKRKIHIAEGVGEMLAATSGIAKDELIVSAGATYLYEGMKVRKWK